MKPRTMTGSTLHRLQELEDGYRQARRLNASDEGGESGVLAVRVL
jgi:hypothetical protein